jgi:hypothetical protein
MFFHNPAFKLCLILKSISIKEKNFNSATGTKNFGAIESNARIFGRDCDQKGRHRHTFEYPVGHNFSSECRKEENLTEFLVELQEIIEREELL